MQQTCCALIQQLHWSFVFQFLPCNLQTKSLDRWLASHYDRDLTQDVVIRKVHVLNLSGAAFFQLSPARQILVLAAQEKKSRTELQLWMFTADA